MKTPPGAVARIESAQKPTKKRARKAVLSHYNVMNGELTLTKAAKQVVDERFFRNVTPFYGQKQSDSARFEEVYKFLSDPLEASAAALAQHLYLLNKMVVQAWEAAALAPDPAVKAFHTKRARGLHRDFLAAFAALERHKRGGTQKIVIERVDQAAIVVGGGRGVGKFSTDQNRPHPEARRGRPRGV